MLLQNISSWAVPRQKRMEGSSGSDFPDSQEWSSLTMMRLSTLLMLASVPLSLTLAQFHLLCQEADFQDPENDDRGSRNESSLSFYAAFGLVYHRCHGSPLVAHRLFW